jgi:metal-dependent amidase/aminoacylase/carboxypeptidase family protein
LQPRGRGGGSRGGAAHAAAAPEEGINALDAVLLTFNAIHALRLRLRPDAKVHGIITHGGTAVNIIPDYAAAQFSVRAREMTYAEEVADRIVACAEGAAVATGATLEWQQTAGYAELRPNPVLARLFAANWRAVGVAIEEVAPGENAGSTDVGNVSHVVPTLQPYIAIAPRGTAGHSIAFREAAISPRGQAAMLDAARGLALTAIDLLAEPALVAEARAALAQGSCSPRKEQEIAWLAQLSGWL